MFGFSNSIRNGDDNSLSAYCSPLNFEIEEITGGIRLTWTPCLNAETEIWLSIDNGEYTLITTTGLTVGTYDYVTDNGVNLSFKLRSKYDATVLLKPTNLRVIAITGGAILTWDNNNTEENTYEIYRKVGAGSYELLSTTLANVVTYTHIGAESNATYKVRAKEGTLPVYSDYSDEKTIVTYTAIVADANKDKVVLTFSESLDETKVPAISSFTLAGKTISNVAVSGTALTLTVTEAYISTDVITVVYAIPLSNPLTGLTTGMISAFTKSVANQITPATLTDTLKTLGWYVASDTATITKNASEQVSAWNDKSGSNHHLLNAGADNTKPVWSTNGMLFDGSNDRIKANAFTWNQPCVIYMVFKQVTWGAEKFIRSSPDLSINLIGVFFCIIVIPC